MCEIIQRIGEFLLKLITSTHFQFDTNGSSVYNKPGFNESQRKDFHVNKH